MFTANANSPAKTTAPIAITPFYTYAAISFLAAGILLFIYSSSFNGHYFHPKILAITHIMALGWGVMIILGASHQLIPVLIESSLFSIALARLSFFLAGAGIPLLAYGFFVFSMGWEAQWGGILINIAIIFYLINLFMSMRKSKSNNVHALFVLTAACWLLLTTLIGLLLIYNFTYSFLSRDSLHYLPLHANIGIGGWFLLLVMGVGTRLIPMFLISKYQRPKLLWAIYLLVNAGLLGFVLNFLYIGLRGLYLAALLAIGSSLVLLAYYCYQCYQARLRKKIDEQMQISLLAVVMMALPLILLILIICAMQWSGITSKLALLYGFVIFFGWLTAIILGMTFKTLPFIIWNKTHHLFAANQPTPSPKDLFSAKVFTAMSIAYLPGFILFSTGIALANTALLKSGSAFILLTAVLYNWNVIKLIRYKPKKS